ncbi:MAG: hypothetical protein ICV78_24570 [Tolypothrix sp. Co-bin9]|nr:hypothetical protein [Tolypothrix sp. Co-bin9]
MMTISLTTFIGLLVVAGSTNAYAIPSIHARSQTHFVSKHRISMTNNNSLIKKVTLIARQENLPPLGIPRDPQRNIGLASVFILLENPQTNNVTVKISKVEIRNLLDGKLQDFQSQYKEIELKPLENSEILVELTNKSGYIGHDRVKAVVTYHIENQSKTIESEAVAVNLSNN